MTDEVDTRVSLDLDPEIIPSMDYYDEDTRPVLAQTENLLRNAHAALVSIHDAKAAAATDPTLNPSAQLLKTDDYANARMTPITKEWDRVVATLENNIAAFQKELDQPIIDATAKSVSAEIRSHFKGLKTGERVSAIQAAIEAGDESTVAAVCGAPSYLSGLDPELQASLKREWSERQNPKLAKRLRAVTAAHDHLLKRGSLLIGEWQKGVGVIEETREGPNGRRIVTKTIRASDIRAKKNRANEAFVLPTN